MARVRYEDFNQLRLQVSASRIRYFVNGDLVHEKSKPTTASPWLNLYSLYGTSTAVRNLKFTGNMVVPREVHLLLKDEMPGWSSDFYGESQPASKTESEEGTVSDEESNEIDNDDDEDAVPVKRQKEDLDWEVKDAILRGRRLPPSAIQEGAVHQGRLYYHRPLVDGDRVRYEFWYEAGHHATHVHPTLGRMAFLLEPGGLTLHWMTGKGTEDNRYSLPADNRLDEESNRKGPIALSEKNWNTALLSFKNDVVTITVNGKPAGEVKFERENDRVFGFYHDKNKTAVQVRNIVMQGDWPETISTEIATNLLAPSIESTAAQRQGHRREIPIRPPRRSADRIARTEPRRAIPQTGCVESSQ
jgi:hypothetical protein